MLGSVSTPGQIQFCPPSLKSESGVPIVGVGSEGRHVGGGGGSSCSQTPSRAIPTSRVALREGVQLPPGDYSTTPGGKLFSTTPGGTRIIYDQKFLMECRNSPVAKTPPKDLPAIPGVTSPTSDEPPMQASQSQLHSSPEDKRADSEESQFEIDI
ncbi:eukaryotic translation initiation factor 4E-binding protein 1 [Sigmodon hispidus]